MLIQLDSGRLALTFDAPDSKLRLGGLTSLNGRVWIWNTDVPAPIWRLGFQSSDSAFDVDSAGLKLAGVKSTESWCEFTWNVPLGDGFAEVVMQVRLLSGDPISYWSLSSSLPDGWRVTRSEFPLIPGIRLDRGLKMAAPAGWGLEYDMKPGVMYDGSYPSCRAGMQFLAFYSQGRGLYIGAHDARGGHKYFKVTAGDKSADYLCLNWPALSEESGGMYEIPYESAVGVFDGSYFDAAQIYRDFTFETPWGSAGSISSRPMPQWVKDTDLWLFSELTVEENLSLYKKAVDYFDVPTGFHWYRWHQIPHDVMYPGYFPTKPGFADAVKEVQAAGWHVMPYINGRLTDPNSPWWAEGGSEYAVRSEAGGPNPEVYIPDVPLNVMCPYTRGWQGVVAGLVKQLRAEIGVDGVYIDQIGAAGPVRCFDSRHGHALGAGPMWADGYRQMLVEARKMLHRDGILATEENAECWIDQFDLQLMANTPTTDGQEIIPLFPAVYSGRSLLYGFQYPAWDDIVKSLPFRAKMARSFLWGAQPGWVRLADLTRTEAAKEAEFLRNIARCRKYGHEFLVYGRFEGMLSVRGGNPRMRCDNAYGSFGGTYTIDLPAVMASCWISEDGRLGVVLTNMSDETRRVNVHLPLARAGIGAAGGFTLRTFGPEGLISAVGTEAYAQEIEIPARSARILSAECR